MEDEELRMKGFEAYEKAKISGWSRELEDIIINSNSDTYLYWFAAYIAGANIKRLERIVIERGNVDTAYSFAWHVPNANAKDLIECVLIKEPRYIKTLFKNHPEIKEKYLNS